MTFMYWETKASCDLLYCDVHPAGLELTHGLSLGSACFVDTAFPPQGSVPQAAPRHASPALDGTRQREEQA